MLSEIKNLEKVNMELEMKKSKKTRRGKKVSKMRFRHCDVENSDSDFCPDCVRNSPYQVPKKCNSKKKCLRPVNGASAPLNYTQFIMNDHTFPKDLPELIDCNIFSHNFDNFRSKDCLESYRLIDNSSSDSEEPQKKSPMTADIDYEYESPEDIDTFTYLLQDFENAFHSMREEELQTMSKIDLVFEYEKIDQKVQGLESKLNCYSVEENTSPEGQTSESSLDEMLMEYEDLKKANAILMEENQELKSKIF